METTKFHPCLTYGINHTRHYVPSVVTSLLDERDEHGRLLKRHSDVHLILRQEKLQRSIGVEALRRHFDQMRMNGNTSMSTDNLTDDQLFAMIEPKAVNNLTTAYEWANYLQDHHKELQKKHKEYMDKVAKDREFWSTFGKKDDKDKSKSD